MSPETLDTLKRQTDDLSAREKSILANYLLEQIADEKTSVAQSAGEAKRARRQAWIKAHGEQYGGMYVALDGDRLLGTGKNYAEAFESARRVGVTDAFVDFIKPHDYVGEIGGW